MLRPPYCRRFRSFIPLAFLFAGCGAGSSEAPKSLILIVIDTLRGDRLGYSGYARAITPTLDSLAAAGVVFDDAMTPAPLTLPAVASLLTGRLPFHHGIRDNDRFVLSPGEETLAERFAAAGFRTGAVVGSAVLARDRGLDQGFEVYEDRFSGPYPVYDPTLEPLISQLASSERRADVVTDRALEMLKSFAADPFFLLVHYFDVHMFYDPPPAYRSLHGGDAYDGEVSFVDAEIGRLLRGIDMKDALVVVVSDHGESNGEHGEPQHGFLLYQSTLRVAALASGPGAPAGVRRTDLVSLIDFEPTLARLFRLGAPEVPRNGRALELSRAERRPAAQYAEAFHPLVSYGWSELRAIRDGSLKLIEGGGRSELYDLVKDPAELRSMANDDRARELRKKLAAMSPGDDPESIRAAALGRSASNRTEMLEGLGYFGAGASARTAPRKRPHPADALPRWLRTQEAKTLFKDAYREITTGNPAAALTILDQAIALDASLADLWYLRGYARRELSDLDGARADVASALELDPRHKAAIEEMTLIESLLNP
jgi:choline-sulfatase